MTLLVQKSTRSFFFFYSPPPWQRSLKNEFNETAPVIIPADQGLVCLSVCLLPMWPWNRHCQAIAIYSSITILLIHSLGGRGVFWNKIKKNLLIFAFVRARGCAYNQNRPKTAVAVLFLMSPGTRTRTRIFFLRPSNKITQKMFPRKLVVFSFVWMRSWDSVGFFKAGFYGVFLNWAKDSKTIPRSRRLFFIPWKTFHSIRKWSNMVEGGIAM